MNKFLTLLILSISTTGLFSQSNAIERSIQQSIDSIYQLNRDAIGILVHVAAPDLGVSWSGSVGYSDDKNKTPLLADQPILIASSIKTYVSATILKLVEQEKLTIDQPIKSLISTKSINLLKNDDYDLSLIQVKHLMSHTSGIWNYANLDYINHKKENPTYRWTRDEQLQLTTKAGDPLGPPGDQFHYSDANYLLLTEIIEKLTDQPFYTAMRTLLKYEELQLNDTWFPTLEEKPKGIKPLAHQYWGSYDWDSYDLDISWDLYGGGGIASTTQDMAVFLQNYFTGNIVTNDSIRNLIFTEIKTKKPKLNPYYLGLSEDSYHGMTAYGHGGFWSTVMMYFPTINSSISVCILERDKRALRKDVLESISKIILVKMNRNIQKMD